MVENIEYFIFYGPYKTIKNWPQTQRPFFDTSETLRAHDISRMAAQMKRGTKDEVNILLQGKGLDKRRETGEVKLLCALKLGAQEGGNLVRRYRPPEGLDDDD